MEKDDREKVSKVEDLWIDIGAAGRAEAQERLRIGDPGVLAAGVLEFPNGRHREPLASTTGSAPSWSWKPRASTRRVRDEDRRR